MPKWIAVLAIALTVIPVAVASRPAPQWANEPENIRSWFQNLTQPDNPYISCCWEADAFEADFFDTGGRSLRRGHHQRARDIARRQADSGSEQEDEIRQRQSDRARDHLPWLGGASVLLCGAGRGVS